MGIEIERKFLVKSGAWRADVATVRDIAQGYLSEDASSCVRVRILDGHEAVLTVKGRGDGVSRPEFEYGIPASDAFDMMAMCGDRVLRKRRHIIPADGLKWEVDVFCGRHEGLVLAEIELPHSGHVFSRPDWLGDEVTDDPQYLNQVLANRPMEERSRRSIIDALAATEDLPVAPLLTVPTGRRSMLQDLEPSVKP